MDDLPLSANPSSPSGWSRCWISVETPRAPRTTWDLLVWKMHHSMVLWNHVLILWSLLEVYYWDGSSGWRRKKRYWREWREKVLGMNDNGREGTQHTIWGMFFHNLHDADDTWDFAIWMVEECQVSFLHRSKVVSCYSWKKHQSSSQIGENWLYEPAYALIPES